MCAIVALDQTTRGFVADSLRSMGIGTLELASVGELRSALETIEVCGVLLELTTAITATASDKKAILEFEAIYPFARFKLVAHQVRIPGDSLEGFTSKCQGFSPRKIRKFPRETRFLAVYLSENASFRGAEKAVTANISNSGYFVYSARKWTTGRRVWLKFLGNDVIVGGTVRSVRPWGNDAHMPGIGIEVDLNAG